MSITSRDCDDSIECAPHVAGGGDAASSALPTVLEEDASTHAYHFPAQIDFDVTSPNNTANRRRGRFVIKLAATLFLATQDEFDTPGKCATAMSVLWGHTSLAHYYLRHRLGHAAPSGPYTPQQLIKAEGQWKAALGKQALEPDGFQKCWNELVPFFQRNLPSTKREGNSTSFNAASRSTLALSGVGLPRTAAARALADSQSPEEALRDLDLAKVPARCLSVLYEKVVRYLRLASAERRAAWRDCTAEERDLASRGWVPVEQTVSDVHADLHTEASLTTMWAWLLSLEATRTAAFFVALLLPLNVMGKLQFLHNAAEEELHTPAPDRWPRSVTHLRAVWGHKDGDVAAAVLCDYKPVPLRALAVDGESGSRARTTAGATTAEGETAALLASNAWFEYIEDSKPLRKGLQDHGCRLYPSHHPHQVLLPRSLLASLCTPLHPVTPRDNASLHTADLAELVQRTKPQSTFPGTGESAAFGGAAASTTSITAGQLKGLLQPASSFTLAATVAAMTFHASRLAFLPIERGFFEHQSASVCGLEVPVHMMRVDRRRHHHHHDCDNLAAEPQGPLEDLVAVPETVRLVLVETQQLSYGLVCRDTQPLSVSLREGGAAQGCCLVDARTMYDIQLYPNKGGHRIAVLRPPTELLVDLRIASLWDLWMWYGFAPSLSSASTRSASGEAKRTDRDAKQRCQLFFAEDMGVVVRPLPLPETATVVSASASAAATPLCPAFSAACPKQAEDSSSGEATAARDGSCTHDENENATPTASAAVRRSLLTGSTPMPVQPPLLPWEVFPAAEAESLLLQLDRLYRSTLQEACEQWQARGLELLRPPRRLSDETTAAAPPCVSGTRGGDILRALVSAATTVPAWQVRESALWEGLSRWMDAVQAACAMPAFSILLPPDVQVVAPSQLTDAAKETKRLCCVGRKKGIAALRRLVGGLNAATSFFFEAELYYAQSRDLGNHSTWVVEDELTAAAGSLDAPYSFSMGLGGVARDEARWSIASRPEVLLVDNRNSSGERAVSMCLRQASVLHRTCSRDALIAAVEAELTATHPCGSESAPVPPLRLWRFAAASSAVADGTTEEVGGSGVRVSASVPPLPPPKDCSVGDVRKVGVLEEIPTHAAMRHAHGGCRVTPIACDELVLGAAWPAELIVDYILIPPLREALAVYCAKAAATATPPSGWCDMQGRCATVNAAAPFSAEVMTVLIDDLRHELLLVFTDETAMEQSEFFGDGLVDYCVAVAALSYRHTSSNSAIWRGGNITGASTNSALVACAVPRVLREFWMSRRRICNEKRLADCVESLFGAVAKAFWALPLRRRRTAGAVSEPLKSAETAAAVYASAALPDANLLIYVASALLQLLSGSCGGQASSASH